MKLEELLELGHDVMVARESTMNKVDTSTQIMFVPDAVHHYFKLRIIYKNYKRAKEFLKDLVEYDD